jgi:hypothetical protein
MCMFSKAPTPPAPVLPPEPAQAQTPDYATAQNAAGRRATDKAKGTNTILTSGQGVSSAAPTETNGATSGDKKTLLGQ